MVGDAIALLRGSVHGWTPIGASPPGCGIAPWEGARALRGYNPTRALSGPGDEEPLRGSLGYTRRIVNGAGSSVIDSMPLSPAGYSGTLGFGRFPMRWLCHWDARHRGHEDRRGRVGFSGASAPVKQLWASNGPFGHSTIQLWRNYDGHEGLRPRGPGVCWAVP